MIEIQNLLIIIFILYILNKIKITKQKQKKESSNFSQNENKSYELEKMAKIRTYGQIQYDAINYYNNDLETTKQNNNNDLHKYNTLTKLNNKFESSQNKFVKNTITNLPCQQDIIYDTKFFQPSDADIYNPTDFNQINYKERKIQDVYDEIVNGNNIKLKSKKQIINPSEYKNGASNLKTFKNIDWEYEGEDDGMAYDPRISNISAF